MKDQSSNSHNFKVNEPNALEKAIESIGENRFTINTEATNYYSYKDDGEFKYKSKRKNIPDCSKKIIQEHINEYRKTHNKIINQQIENYVNDLHRKKPTYVGMERKPQLLNNEDEEFRPMTSALADLNIKQIALEKVMKSEKPKSAYQGKRNIKGQSEQGYNICKEVRPESRYKKESLCTPLLKERDKSPDYKVPIEKMDYETYKKNNAVLPSCWN